MENRSFNPPINKPSCVQHRFKLLNQPIALQSPELSVFGVTREPR